MKKRDGEMERWRERYRERRERERETRVCVGLLLCLFASEAEI